MTAQEQAEKLAREVAHKITGCFGTGQSGPYEHDRTCERATALITTALLSARNEAIEECARVALSYELPDTGPQDQHGRVMASLQIAAACRALKG